MFAEVGPVVNSTELMVVRDALLHIHRAFYEKVKRGVGDAPSGVNATASGVSATHNDVSATHNGVNGVNATHNDVSTTHNDVNGVNGVNATHNGVNDVNATTNDGSDVNGTTDTPTEMTTSTAEVIREIRSRVLTGRVVYFDGMLQNQVRVQMWREA
mgnify:CR=1 FL=1